LAGRSSSRALLRKGTPAAQNTIFEELANKIKVNTHNRHFEEEDTPAGYLSNTPDDRFHSSNARRNGREHPALRRSPLAGRKATFRLPASTHENCSFSMPLNDYYRKHEEAGQSSAG